MNISSVQGQPGQILDNVVLDKNNANKAGGSGKTSTDSVKSASDSVTLSTASTQLQALEAGSANGEVFDSAKVEEIKAAITKGEFKVDSSKVADALIETVKDLIKTK